jgi:hypothetical protein
MSKDKLVAAALVGAVLGILFGFASYRMNVSGRAQLSDWLSDSFYGGGPLNISLFAIMGAAVVLGIAYLTDMLK